MSPIGFVLTPVITGGGETPRTITTYRELVVGSVITFESCGQRQNTLVFFPLSTQSLLSVCATIFSHYLFPIWEISARCGCFIWNNCLGEEHVQFDSVKFWVKRNAYRSTIDELGPVQCCSFLPVSAGRSE